MKNYFTSFFFKALLICALFVTFNSQLKASHAVGLDVQYECIGNNQYLLTLNFYRDCFGITAPPSADMIISSASCGINTTVSLTLDTFFEISPLCPSALGSSTCNGGNSPGIEQYIYTAIYTFPLQCTDWTIGYGLCCRNAAITNLQTPDSYNIYAQATLNNTLPSCDNSPIFTTRPVPFVCAGQQFNYNHGAIDIDGDSLVYTLINPLDGPGANIPHRGGFTSTNPLSTSGGFNFDRNTGQMTFNPNASQQAVVTVLVQEFRNGVLIGTTMRDMQLVVINSCNNINPTATGINGTTQFTIDVCAGFPLCFDIFTNDQNAGQTTTLTLNNAIAGATFNVSGSPFQQAEFCWRSTVNDIGPNDFSITVTDNACPYFGSNNYTYTVNVIPNPNPPINGGPDEDICANECVPLNATGPPQVVRWRWEPPTGLSNPNIRNPTACPLVTTTYTVFATYADSCASSDEVIIRVQPSPTVNVTPPSAVVCAGSSIQLTGTASSPSTFAWSSGGTGATTIVTPTQNTTYVLSATNQFGCIGTDSALITYSPPPPPQVCNNVYVTPTGNGGGLSKADPTDIVTGIALAQCNNLTIKMAIGTYNIDTALTLSSLLTIEGGFDPTNNWQKVSTAGATTIIRSNANIEGPANAPRLVALYANGATFWRLQDLTIRVDNAPAAVVGQAGVSLYGLHLTGCNNYDVVRCQIITGNAGTGGSGANGTIGSVGLNGQDGNNNLGGIGGCTNGVCGGNGGDGGDGCPLFCSGDDGQDGQAGQGGGGAGGFGANGAAFCGNQPTAGANGTNGGNGSNGSNGPAGAFINGFYEPGLAGGNGTNGQDGSPGGGGGGRGGAQADADGGGGGGGGAGGAGGGGGQGGFGGGSTFAVVLFNNGASGNFITSNLQSGTLGSGGIGGIGSVGGGGGTGGAGGQPSAFFGGCDNNTGIGGNGGSGGLGGNGGSGSNGISQVLRVISGSNPASQDITFNLVAQPTIIVEDISCTQTPLAYSSANASAWNFGAGSVPNTANGATVNTSYSTTGRKNITFNANNYAGFHRIAIDNSTYIPEIQTSALQIGADSFVVCAGAPTDFFTNTPGIAYAWNFGGAIIPNTYASSNLSGLIFNTPGTYIVTLVVTTDCCGPTIPDSITLIVDEQPNIVFAGDTILCRGESTVINVSGASNYIWSPGVGNINTAIANVNLTPNATTIYSIIGNSLLGYCNTAENLTVIINNPATLTTSSTPATCSNDGSATVNASGGSGNYTYAWSDPNNQTTATATSLFTGTYTVTVTDNVSGCTATVSVFVSNNGSPLAYIQTSRNVSCYGGNDGTATAAVASGQAPYTYAWNSGQTTATINNLIIGNYVVTVRDSRGCISIANVTISQPDSLLLVIQDTDSVSCFGGNDGMIDILADGGSGNYQYAWNTNPVQTTDSIGGLTAGTYTILVTDANNCTLTRSITIYEPLPLNLQISTIDATCFNTQDGSAIVSATGSTLIQSYAWSNGDTDSIMQNETSGIYFVTVTDANGCSLADTAIINSPDSIFITEQITNITCFGANDGAISVIVAGGTPGNVPPYTYLWNIANNTTTSISSLSPNTYTITATDGIGCTVSETYTIVEPTEVTVTLNIDNITCFGFADGGITVNAVGGNGGYNYALNGAASQANNVFNNLDAGTYNIVVTDTNACTAAATATITQPSLLTLTIAGINIRCFGEASGSATATANGGTLDYTYSWNTSPTQTNQTAIGLIAGNYTLVVTDANGCSVSDSIALTQPLPIFVDATPDSSAIKFGQTVDLNTTFQNTTSPTPLFSWEPTLGLSCTDCPNPIASPTFTTAYNVTLIDSNGCIANDIVLVIVDLDKILYVPNAFTPDADGTNDVFNIYTLGAKSILFRVFNRWGEKVFETTLLGQGWNGEYLGKLMTPGVFVYYVEVTYLDNETKVAKGSVTLIR